MEMIEFISNLPTWVWVVAVIAVLFLLGDRKLWEYEAKFPLNEGVGRGEVEFKCYKKKGRVIELELKLEEKWCYSPVDVFLNEVKVYTLPAEKNTSGRIYHEEEIEIEDPKEGDKVTVKINSEAVFSGQLIRD